MRSIFDMSGQQILTRALHVLTVLALLEKMALGMPKGYNFDRAPFSMGESFPAVAGQRMRNFHQLAHIGKRSTTVSNAQSAYEMFYNKLYAFSILITVHLKSNAPAVLSSNIGAVTKIITPSDSVFSEHDARNIIKRVMLTVEITEVYLKVLDHHHLVLDNSISWFEHEKEALLLLTFMTKMSLGSLGMWKGDFIVGDAGMGAPNSGHSSSSYVSPTQV